MPIRTQLGLPGPVVWQPRRRRPTRNSWGGHIAVLVVLMLIAVYVGVQGHWGWVPVCLAAWLLLVIRNPPGSST